MPKTVRLAPLEVPEELALRLDRYVAKIQRAKPYETVTRAGVLRTMIHDVLTRDEKRTTGAGSDE